MLTLYFEAHQWDASYADYMTDAKLTIYKFIFKELPAENLAGVAYFIVRSGWCWTSLDPLSFATVAIGDICLGVHVDLLFPIVQ